jgi:hypothetical protein
MTIFHRLRPESTTWEIRTKYSIQLQPLLESLQTIRVRVAAAMKIAATTRDRLSETAKSRAEATAAARSSPPSGPKA